ncbi:G patch domain and ankyrin repeat-containing protein 1 [Aplysia californica]|uniref:G patch domain and ankyrin repeat-containing protein 1 n=1 Tax=Aplysia californica TaxID=6500 RepID=A0ABM0JMQ0_APLCA|nr:G patch domain and ankyrin repeat-containing protein 1 [Aplysia californica]XP_005097296.1 G patch domain and ankyrin repeat-containing protein 1 [Aplysia californica]XP_005097297.1 G patch domain and ankyrin repeat-containing protein 1 [Aplysia californica]
MSWKRKNMEVSYRNLISFVPQRSGEEDKKSKSCRQQQCLEAVQGEEVKNFYESLVKEDSGSIDRLSVSSVVKKHQNKVKDKSIGRRSRRARSSHLQQQDAVSMGGSQGAPAPGSSDIVLRELFKLLHCAETGDTAELSRLVDTGLDINATDMYGWSPLMCAARAGQLECVRLCLRLGAHTVSQHSAGGTAEDLARSAGHEEVASVISSFPHGEDTHLSPVKSRGQNKAAVSEPYFCEVCQMSISPAESVTHGTSTIHLFNAGHKPAGPAYLIPQSNRGFQILLRSGWEHDKGLGPHGQGNKYPVRTLLKHDRKGLGVDQEVKKKQKVTHFEANDKTAVSREHVPAKREVSVRKAAQKVIKAKERRSRRWERDIRYELS